MRPLLLQVEDLVIEFDTREGRRRVVDKVSFQLHEGEVLGVLGESGSGKTLSALAILGLVAGQPGVVEGNITLFVDGIPVPVLAGLERSLKRRGDRWIKDSGRWQRTVERTMRPLWGRVATAVFQNPRQSLDPLMTVGAQVEESIGLSHPEISRRARRNRAVEYFERVRMSEPVRVHGSYPHELSGGMCQRAMIAVALAREPLLLIADEPTTGLDTTVRAEIVQLFQELMVDKSMLYISHDVREVLYLSHRVIVMRHGKIIDSATPDELRTGGGPRDTYTESLLSAADLKLRGAV